MTDRAVKAHRRLTRPSVRLTSDSLKLIWKTKPCHTLDNYQIIKVNGICVLLFSVVSLPDVAFVLFDVVICCVFTWCCFMFLMLLCDVSVPGAGCCRCSLLFLYLMLLLCCLMLLCVV